MTRVVVHVFHENKSAGYVTSNKIHPLSKDLNQAYVFKDKTIAHRSMSSYKNRRGIVEKGTSFSYEPITLSIAPTELEIEWEDSDTGC